MNLKFLFASALAVVTLFSYAQEKGNITGKFYILDVDVVVREFDLIQDAFNGEDLSFIAKSGTKFTAYEFKEDNRLLVKFWNFKTESSGEQEQPRIESMTSYQYISKATDGGYFLMDLEDFNKKASEYYGFQHGVTWGFSTLPIKLRFGGDDRQFQYATGFSLGVNAGYEWQFKSRVKQSLGLLMGIGISTVAIDPETVTDDYIDKSSTTGAFTPSLGLVYSFENFQIGLFSGIDYIPGEMGDKWVYKNQPWLGLGLGFTIFQKNKTESGESQSQ